MGSAYTDSGWERLSISLNFLVPKLPAPKEEDLSKGILESSDMDSYRVEKHAAMRSKWLIKMPESSPCQPQAGDASRNPNSIDCQTSSKSLMTSSAKSLGTTPTESTS